MLSSLAFVYLLSACEHSVELLEEDVSGVWSAMDHRFILSLSEDDILTLQETVEMLPVVQFLLELEAVVKLVHLELFRVVARQDLSVHPSIGEITLWISDLVGQVE